MLWDDGESYEGFTGDSCRSRQPEIKDLGLDVGKVPKPVCTVEVEGLR